MPPRVGGAERDVALRALAIARSAELATGGPRSGGLGAGAPGDPASAPPDEALRDVLRRLTGLATRLAGAPIGLVSLVYEDHDVWLATRGLPAAECAVGGTRERPTFCEEAVVTRAPVVVEDARAHARFARFPAVAAHGIGACLAAPLISAEGHALGSLCVFDPAPRAWTEDDVAALSDLAASVVAALERHAARAALRDVVETGPDATYFLRGVRDATGRIVDLTVADCNRGAATLAGRSRDAVIGHSWRTAFDSPQTDANFALLAGVADTGEPAEAEFEVRDPRATARRVQIRAARVGDGVLVTARDITERTMAEAALHASEARHRSLVESLPLMIYQAKPEPPYTALYVSPGAVVFGYPPAEWLATDDLWVRLLHPDDRPRVLAEARAALARGESEHEYRLVAKDGTVHWIHDRGRFLRNEAGDVTAWQGIMIDVTARRAAEAALRESEARLERIAANVPGMVFQFALAPDGTAGFTYASAGARAISGVEPDVVCARRTTLPSVHPDDLPSHQAALAQSAATLEPYRWEGRIRTPSGGEKWVQALSRPERRTDGTVVWDGILLDITDRKLAETAIAEREAWFRALIDHARDVVGVIAADGTILYESPAVQRVLGHDPDCMVGRASFDYVHPDDRAAMAAQIAAVLATTGATAPVTYRRRHADGSWRTLEGDVWNLVAHPAVGGVVINVRDVTERTRAELALRVSEARYRALLAHFPEGAVFLADADLRVLVADGQAFRDAGFRAEDVVGRHLSALLSPEAFADAEPFYRAALGGAAHTADIVANGRVFDTRAVPVRDGDGSVVAAMVISRDVTARRAADDRLRLLEAAVANLNDVVVITEADTIDAPGPRIVYVNEAFVARTGYSRSEVLGRSPRLLQGPETDRATLDRVRAALGRSEPIRVEVLNYTKSGESYWLELDISPIRDGGGRTTHFVAVERDVSERKLLERQLREAQKLEAIGQLAAGIAHEINTPMQYVGDNLRFTQDAFRNLTPVLTQLTALAEEAGRPGADPVLPAGLAHATGRADLPYLLEEIPSAVQQALEGADRVAEIVRGMKLCSHPGGVLVGVDLGQQLEKMLAVTRSEWKYVANLVTDYDPALPPVSCDVGEINQVFLNLLVNAAHAVSDARASDADALGTITVRTRAAGDAVEVRISDTGGGIPDAIRDRIFDPFFTTKEVGRGTGQGLAIAHRVMARHAGSITVETALGEGSTFILRLPIAPAAVSQPH